MVLQDKVLSLPIKIQRFSFFPTYINYILQNSSPEQLLKLYQCCKDFYSKLEITIASNIEFTNCSQGNKYKIGGHYYTKNVEKIWLTGELRIFTSEPYCFVRSLGDEFLNKMHRNNLTKLSIYLSSMLFKELSILSNSPDLVEVNLSTSVKNDENQPILFEEIMVIFPKIKHFVISTPHFTMETFKKLSKFKFSNKFKTLNFWSILTQFDPISFCDFLRENFDDKAHFVLQFALGYRHLEDKLLPQVKEIIDGWEKTKKPKCFF